MPAGTGICRYHDIEIEPFTPRTPPIKAALPGVAAPSPFPEEVEVE